MKKIFLILAMFCVTATATVSAQKVKTGADYENLRGPFVTNSFGDNWFISVGAGINGWLRTSPGGDEYRGFNKITETYQLTVGKMLHPYYGVRVQGNYGNLRDYTSFAGMFTPELIEAGQYDLKFGYWNVEADAIFHFSNAVGGYKAARFYNLMLVGGMGFGRSHGRDLNDTKTANNEFMVNFSLLNTFRLSQGWDLYAELKTQIVRQQFASTTSGVGMIPSLTFGFTYKFKDRRFYTVQSAIDKALEGAGRPYEQRISQLERDLAASEALAAKYKAEAEAAPKTVTKTVTESSPFVVFFKKNSAELSQFEKFNIFYMADVIKANPDKVYYVIGHADKETGTPEFNMELSEKRAQVVRQTLIDAGISPSKLNIKAVGDTANQFKINEMNRVVIVE